MRCSECPPSPGSYEAGKLGCNCPIYDNAKGRGAWGSEGDNAIFYVRDDCPLHGAQRTHVHVGDA